MNSEFDVQQWIYGQGVDNEDHSMMIAYHLVSMGEVAQSLAASVTMVNQNYERSKKPLSITSAFDLFFPSDKKFNRLFKNSIARDCIMQLYKFEEHLSAVRKLIPLVAPKVANDCLRKFDLAKADYDAKFEHIKNMRDAISHLAEITANIQLIKKRQLSGDTLHLGGFSKGQFRITYRKKHYEQGIDAKMVLDIIQIIRRIYRSIPGWDSIQSALVIP